MPTADPARKLRIYRILYRLNLSFANIVGHCGALGQSGMLSPKFTKLYQSYAQELQAEINDEVVSLLESVESDDMFRFGKARTAREKELRDPDDVFLQAEERRREIARQRRGNRPSARKKTPQPPRGRKDAPARKAPGKRRTA